MQPINWGASLDVIFYLLQQRPSVLFHVGHGRHAVATVGGQCHADVATAATAATVVTLNQSPKRKSCAASATSSKVQATKKKRAMILAMTMMSMP
jgi:hypothetical protein